MEAMAAAGHGPCPGPCFASVPSAPQILPSRLQKAFCPWCGGKRKESFAFCPTCGGNLN